MPRARRVNVDGLMRLQAFSHAVVAGDQIYVAGTLGTIGNEPRLADGGMRAQTVQALRNIERILAECDATLADVVKVNAYITDMAAFEEMNEGYSSVFGGEPPARITVGCAGLALGAAVEFDCVAIRPSA
jgi:2-iminobutanoate/2-iminopropanoate deaminase